MKLRTMDLERDADGDAKSSSECSSGCQSGWTMYLDHSDDNRAISAQQQDAEDEEDLSMVSDASSGPPHPPDNEDEHCRYCMNGRCFCSAASSLLPRGRGHGGKKRRVEAQRHEHGRSKQEPRSPLLDDTASSPFFGLSPQTSLTPTASGSCSNNKKLFVDDALDLSCGFSATQFKGKSALRKHMGYFKSCDPTNPASVSSEGGEKKLW